MNKKFLKIYVYPLFIITLSLIPWYLFAIYILKIDLHSFLLQALECKTETCVRNFKVFCISTLMLIYLLWVGLNTWRENSLDEKEKEVRTISFFLSYGKIFVAIVLLQFALIILFIGFGII